MLTDNNAMATIAVKDMAAARKFYEGTLHFKRSGGELEAIVRSLQDAGVRFEHCDLPGARREGDIHIFGDFRAAWFKDPDGNILHVNSG